MCGRSCVVSRMRLQPQETHRERHLSPVGSPRGATPGSCGSSRAGIVPGYQGHVPRAACHFGSTHEGGTEQSRSEEIFGLTHDQHFTLRDVGLAVTGLQAATVSFSPAFLSPRPGTSTAAQPRRRGVFDNSQQLLAEARAEAARAPAPQIQQTQSQSTQHPRPSTAVSIHPPLQPSQQPAWSSPRDLPPVRTSPRARPTTRKLRPQEPFSRVQIHESDSRIAVAMPGSARFGTPFGRYGCD